MAHLNTVRVTRRRLRYEAKAAPRLIREISQRIALPLNLNFFCKDLLSGLMSDVGCKAGPGVPRLDCCWYSYGTQLPYMYHTCMAHGRFERTIGQNLTLFESYVLKLLRHGVLRDPNTNFRIE